MAQFTVYHSALSGAPTLTGQVGSLVNVLDAVLVTGWGGVGGMLGAGWSKPFTGANKACFRAPSGARQYLRVQDDAPGAGGAREARLRGYEGMTDVDTGTNAFPTVAQMASGPIARKSTTADATARAWICFADARTFYFFSSTGDNAGAYQGFMFGEYWSRLSAPAYNTIIIGRPAENTGAMAQERLNLLTTTNSFSEGHYIARNNLEAVGSWFAGKVGATNWSAGQQNLYGTIPYPNPVDSKVYVSPVRVCDFDGKDYGIMRGFWHFPHVFGGVNDREIIDGVGDTAGRQFMIVKQGTTGVFSDVYCIEISNTLETN